jgi:hypothetical protein
MERTRSGRSHFHAQRKRQLRRFGEKHAKGSFDRLVAVGTTVVLVLRDVYFCRLGPPYLMERKPRYEGEILTGNARYEGFSMDLIDAIAGILGFKYEFRLAQDGKYGNYDPATKSWNGLIKDLLDRVGCALDFCIYV